MQFSGERTAEWQADVRGGSGVPSVDRADNLENLKGGQFQDTLTTTLVSA